MKFGSTTILDCIGYDVKLIYIANTGSVYEFENDRLKYTAANSQTQTAVEVLYVPVRCR